MTTTAPSRATASRGRLLVLVAPAGQHVDVLVAGELDCATAPLLRQQVVASLFYRPGSLLLDATDLTFCDLHGLDALVDAVEEVERSGVSVTVRPSAQLAWLVATVDQLPPTSGQPGRAPAGCPLLHRPAVPALEPRQHLLASRPSVHPERGTGNRDAAPAHEASAQVRLDAGAPSRSAR